VCVVLANISISWVANLSSTGINLQNFLVTRDRPVGNIVTNSAGLTIVANVAIATGPALSGAPRSSGSKSYLLHYI